MILGRESILKFLLFLITFVGCFLAAILGTEISSGLFVRQNVIKTDWQTHATQFDAQYGWVNIPSSVTRRLSGDIHHNSLGFRSPELDPTKEQILLVGDSVTWGYGVDEPDTLSSQLQEYFDKSLTQVTNLGVSGYGPDLEYLKLKESIHLFPKVKATVLIICTGNDFADVQSDVAYGVRKPKYIFEQGELKLIGRPIWKYGIRNLLFRSVFYDRYIQPNVELDAKLGYWLGDNVSSVEETRKLISALVAKIGTLAQEHGSEFYLVVSPLISDLEKKSDLYLWFEKMAAESGFQTIDFYSALRQRAKEDWFIHDKTERKFHFNGRGLNLLADMIYRKMTSPKRDEKLKVVSHSEP
jgi:hypothetical protein